MDKQNSQPGNATAKSFGLKRLRYSFSHSFDGLRFALANEQNMRIHLTAAIAVVVCGFVLRISAGQWLVCLLMIGLVMAAELFNTAIEATIDLSMPQHHALAKSAKDVAAAAVLILSIVAAIIGLVIFIPQLIALFNGSLY